MTARQGICLNALIIKNNEILLLKRSNSDSTFPGEWELPGGGSEYRETAIDALKREVKEECGLDIKICYPLAVNNFYIKKRITLK